MGSRDSVRCERLGATGEQQGLYVRFDYGFGTNVHLGYRLRDDGWKPTYRDYDKFGLSIVGWERLCELVDEWRRACATRRRLLACVKEWPDCEEGKYDPRCCRFPKSCSCTVYDERYVTEADLEPA